MCKGTLIIIRTPYQDIILIVTQNQDTTLIRTLSLGPLSAFGGFHSIQKVKLNLNFRTCSVSQ